MRDSRVTIWTNPTTISADGDTTGPSIDLLGDYTGDHAYGTGTYGIPVEVMAYGVVTGTGDGFTVTVIPQFSDDDTNWVDAGEIGVFTMDTDGLFANGLTRNIVNGRPVNAMRYFRLKATAAGITGGETVNIKAWLSDGANPFVGTGAVR